MPVRELGINHSSVAQNPSETRCFFLSFTSNLLVLLPLTEPATGSTLSRSISRGAPDHFNEKEPYKQSALTQFQMQKV